MADGRTACELGILSKTKHRPEVTQGGVCELLEWEPPDQITPLAQLQSPSPLSALIRLVSDFIA